MNIDDLDISPELKEKALACKTPEELLGHHLTLKELPEFTIVGITDKESPCIYASQSLFINMLANNSNDDYYDGDFESEEDGSEAPFA